MAMLSSTLLGDDPRATALVSLNGFLAGQKSDGRWEDTDTGAQVPALHFTQAFMMGLVMESLIMYDRVIGDPRIIPALTAATAYLWNTAPYVLTLVIMILTSSRARAMIGAPLELSRVR